MKISGIRALGLCLSCRNARELVTQDPVKLPGEYLAEEVACLRLKKHWPDCVAGEEVFSTQLVCANFVIGSPLQVFNPLRIVAPFRAQ